MRIAASSLALSLVLLAGPALAQTAAGPTSSGIPQNQQSTNADRYELTGPPPGQVQSEPMQQMMRHHQRMMQQGQMQSGPMMQHGMQSGMAQQPGQMGQGNAGAVSFATQGQIKHSLETSGFKNVAVLPQSYLIRATAPDGSRIVMQVSPEGLYGVVVNPAGQGEGNPTASGGTSSNTGTGTGSSGTSSSDTGTSISGGTGTGTSANSTTGMGNGTDTGTGTGTGSSSGMHQSGNK